MTFTPSSEESVPFSTILNFIYTTDLLRSSAPTLLDPLIANRVVARQNLMGGQTKIKFCWTCSSSLPRARRSTKVFMFNYGPLLLKWGLVSKLFVLWGHAISWMAFWLCSFSLLIISLSQTNAKWTIFKICAGQHNVFCSECRAKIESPGQVAQHHPPWLQHCLQLCDKSIR